MTYFTNTTNKKFAIFLILALFTSVTTFAQTVVTHNVSGTWTVPAGITSITVECWGGGAAGGGNTTGADGAGGGGGGAYSISDLTVTPSATYDVEVGLGGIGVSGATGGNGDNSWFDNNTVILAVGGTGGNPPVGGNGGIAGVGGAAGSCIGTTTYSGGNGGAGANHSNGAGGGGGSSAGTSTDGNDGSAASAGQAGSGGAAPTGGGAGGAGGTKNNPGNDGTAPGGAGGGAGDSGGNGGNGADGKVVITYYEPDCPVSTSVAPSAIQTLCQGDASDQLTATITTTGGSGSPSLLYQWYYNTTNSNTVSGATSISGATSASYTPLTTASELGSRWYFCVGYAIDNSCGQTNTDQSLASNAVEVTVNPPTPVQPGAITGPASVSPSTGGLIYSITAVPNATTYNWSVPAGWTINSGNGTISISVTSGLEGENGNITVTAQNSCGTSTASVLAVTVVGSDCPSSTSVAPEGIQTRCQGIAADELTATVTTTGGSGTPSLLYQWYYNTTNSNTVAGATLIAGATSSTYTPLTGAPELGSRWYFCVGYATDNSCGQTNTDQGLASNAVEVTVNTVPAAGPITGPTPVASGTPGLIYSITAIPGATNYTWSVPGNPGAWSITAGQGTNSITVTSGTNSGDYIDVYVSNACGDGSVSQLQVFIGAVPDCPSSTSVAPSGVQTICQDNPANQLTATITTSGGSGSPTLLYQWYYNTTNSNTVAGATLIGGATSSTYTPLTSVTELGNRWYFCVGYATDNGCAQTNADQSLASNAVEVNVITTPSVPGAISGNASVSPSTSGLVYSITAVANATSYTWTVPTGWSITAGQGTISMTATSGTTGQNGDITVTANNSCGSSTAQTLAVIVGGFPTITLGDNPAVCQGTTTANLPYSATTNNPDQYSINYNSTAEGVGFVDVTNAALPVVQIGLTVPGGAALDTYYGVLTVRNSSTGFVSINYTISVTIYDTPVVPILISGPTTTNEGTQYEYSTNSVPTATTYTWNVPTGWTINSGNGTTNIIVTTGSAGQNGDITVTAGNSCGTSGAQTLAVICVTPTDHTYYNCSSCHIFHNAPGVSLTSATGNALLCQSCHISGGLAATLALPDADKAIPGTSGNSHAWDVASVNATYETVLTSDPDMVLRIDGGNILCSTCHDQHNPNTITPYLRVSNAGDAMCKDCHSPRNVLRFSDDPSGIGSHPVGVVYSGSGSVKASPTGSMITVGGNVECSSCHQMHFASTSDGYLLRQTNDNSLCTDCHTYSTHNGFSCKDCHQTHNPVKDNIFMIKDIVNGSTVNFYAESGPNSFAGSGSLDGICEVCHTSTQHYQADGTSPDQNHTSSGGPMDETNCTGCHPHSSDFSPSGGGCDDCHISTTDWDIDGHAKHITGLYTYSCNTCHLNYGMSGSLEPTHPSGTANVNFDPDGLATRNGQDGNIPVLNGDKTCDNIYCHSNGVSADRATDGTYTWGSLPFGTMTYATTPSWTAGTITDCTSCHPGVGNMTDPYTITPPGPLVNSADDYPNTGEHRKGQHYDLSQNITYSGGQAQCFFCHNTESSLVDAPRFQGTYGTTLHVDGATHFSPIWLSNGGTMIDPWSHSYEGSAKHCALGKSCW